MTDLPLSGLKVLDIGDFIAAPYAAMLLADWGADVIKVEPLDGDTARSVGELVAEPDVSAIFVSANRGKRSVSLELRSKEGRDILQRLACSSDVVVHNRTPAQASKLGIDFASLSARCPEIVVGSITAFGEDGPYAGRGALDLIPQAMSGLMSVTGPVEGPPTRCGVTVVDFGAGLTLASGILAALWACERTGRGRAVATSLLDVALTFTSSLFPLSSALGQVPPRLNNRSHPLLADQFATADGFIVLAVWDERRWSTLCEILGLDALARNPSLDSNLARLERYDEVQPALAQAIAPWRAAELTEALVAAGIICAQTYDIDQVRTDPHVKAVGALYEESRFGTSFTMVRSPLQVDGHSPRSSIAPPRLGADTDEILRKTLGYDDAGLRALRDGGTIR